MASATVTEGPYVNAATVAVRDAFGRTDDATDLAHHVGMVIADSTRLVVEKAVNAAGPLNPTAAEDARRPRCSTAS